MTDGDTFTDFIRRIRAGDEDAAAELVRKYEAAVRMEIRFRLRDQRLRRVLDSMDICQSVLGSFFVRAAAGQYDLDQPEQLLRLLVSIARNKVALEARKGRAGARDVGRQETCDLRRVAASEPGPSQLAAGKDLLARFRERLTSEELLLADRRAQGLGWEAIAAELGGTPQARRKQLSRAVERVLEQLGLDRASHE